MNDCRRLTETKKYGPHLSKVIIDPTVTFVAILKQLLLRW